VGVVAGGLLVGTELVEVVVASDLLELVRCLLHRVSRVGGVAERCALRLRGFSRPQQGAGTRGQGSREQFPATEVGLLRRDLRRGDAWDTDFHESASLQVDRPEVQKVTYWTARRGEGSAPRDAVDIEPCCGPS